MDLSYALLGRTKFDGRLANDTTRSVEAAFSVQKLYSLEVLQNILGPVDVVIRGSKEKLTYPENRLLGLPGRSDLTDIYGGGLSFRVTQRLTASLNYELGARRSPQPGNSYDRERLYTTIFLRF